VACDGEKRSPPAGPKRLRVGAAHLYLAGGGKAGVPLQRFLRGAVAAYRRFLFTADPAHRFHCWATIQAVSAGLDQLERRGAGHGISGSVPDGLNPGPALAGLTDRAR